MYYVNIKTTGKYGNFATGVRIFKWKRYAKNFIKMAEDSECEFDFCKMTKCGHAWTKKI